MNNNLLDGGYGGDKEVPLPTRTDQRKWSAAAAHCIA